MDKPAFEDRYQERKLKEVRARAPVSYPPLEETGKLPPQAIQIEEAVLGALMLEKDALTEVLDILTTPEIFYKEEHQEIFKAILKLFDESKPIDILTVTSELRSSGKLDAVGGPYYISELTNRVGSSANIEFHARILVEKYLLRELIKISTRIQSLAYEETTDVFELLDDAERALYNISTGNLKGDYISMKDLIRKSLEELEEIMKNREDAGYTGVPTGFSALDRITSGWQKSDLIIIASRPAMGKTSLVLSMARNAAVDFKKTVAIFSLEMSAIQLVHRLISAEANLDAAKLRNGTLEPFEIEVLHQKISRLSEAKIFIDDTPALNIFDLRAKCRRLKSQHQIDLVIIDYLQLMNAHKEQRRNDMNREREISTISRALKSLAKELNIPVIALSQLSREVEKRGSSKRPILSDLRESGSIEQDADQVLFIYRPSYYGLTEDENNNPTEGIAEIIIAKNRHGETRTIKLGFEEKFARFVDLDMLEKSYYRQAQNGNTIVLSSRANDIDTPESDMEDDLDLLD